MNERTTTNRRVSKSERALYVVRCSAFALLLLFVFAALRFPTSHWCDVVTTITVVVLFTAVLRVVYERGRSRALWLGFALFGWGSLILLSIPGENLFVQYPPHVLGYIALKILTKVTASRASSSFVHLSQIVNCFFVWIVAALGALIGWWAYRAAQPDE